jgi:hypothetical protein
MVNENEPKTEPEATDFFSQDDQVVKGCNLPQFVTKRQSIG